MGSALEEIMMEITKNDKLMRITKVLIVRCNKIDKRVRTNVN